MKTPEEIYKICPKLSNIADRLADSEIEAAERNKEYKAKGSPKKKFPEHFKITKIYTSHWEEVPGIAKNGRQAFEKAITSIIDTREPSALTVEVYGGKRKTPNADSYICYLSSDPDISRKIENPDESNLGGLGNELAVLKDKVTEIVKNGNPSHVGDSSLAIQLKDMQHKFDIATLKMQYEQTIKEQQDEIETLEEEIKDLNEMLADQDAELGNAAEMLEAKTAPKPFHTLLSGILETAAENFIISRPKILTDMFKLSPDQVKQIFTKEQPKQLPESQSANEASFSEAGTPADDEYKDFDPKHAGALKNLNSFARSLPLEAFTKFWQICAFCCTSEGDLDEEHTNELLRIVLEKTQTNN